MELLPVWMWTWLPSVWSPGQGEGARRATVLMTEAELGGTDTRPGAGTARLALWPCRMWPGAVACGRDLWGVARRAQSSRAWHVGVACRA